jgi:uncharacterized protein (DUF58 family)
MFGLIRRPLQHQWQRRAERWMERHHPRSHGPHRLNRRRIYILPTAAGWVYASMTLVILLAAMNYSNALGFGLAFWLAAIGFVVMHETHANLLGLEVQLRPANAVFAGETAEQPVSLHNLSRKARMAITISQDRQAKVEANTTDCSDSAQAMLYWRPQRRGRLQPPRFALSTDWPLGLFRAWSWIHLDGEQWVFPSPAAQAPPIPPAQHRATHGQGKVVGEEDLAGIRNYARGDSARQIYWRTLANHDQLNSKLFEEPVQDTVWVEWELTRGRGDVEARLQIMCRWMLDLAAQNRPYGLALPGVELPPDLGPAHQVAGLKRLAEFEHAR